MNMPLSADERALLAKLGKKGGNARKRRLTKKRIREIASMGGKARQAKRNGS